MRPDVMVPMFTRLPDASIRCVPAAAPVFIPVVALKVAALPVPSMLKLAVVCGEAVWFWM